MMKRKAGAGSILYQVDSARNLPAVVKVCFDEEISESCMKEALKKTLKVYPLANAGVEFSDGNVWLIDNHQPLELLHQKQCIRPGSDKLNKHWTCVNYDGNALYVIVSHAITDGRGMLWFTETLTYYYCCLKYQKNYAPADDARTEIGGTYPDDETDYWEMDYSDVLPVPKAEYQKVGYVLPENKNKKNEKKSYVKLTVPESAFMEFVRKNGTSPSVMMYLLFAMAVYQTRPEAEEPIVARLTVDARKNLDIPHSFFNCSLGAHFSVNRQMISNTEFSELCQKLRKSLKAQNTPEYLRCMAKELVEEKALLPDVKPTVSVSYMGKVPFGEYQEHITDFLMAEEEFHKINAYAYHHEFHLILNFGSGSSMYGAAMADILKQNGIPVQQSEMIFLEDAQD